MNQKERQLEEISKKVSNYEPIKYSPIFEMYVTMISIAMAIMLFLFPDMLVQGASDSGLYSILLSIMPQWMWAFAFFFAGLFKAIGLLVESKIMRIIGLILSAIVYTIFAIAYAASGFPNVGGIVMTATAVFSLISISEVRRSSINQ